MGDNSYEETVHKVGDDHVSVQNYPCKVKEKMINVEEKLDNSNSNNNAQSPPKKWNTSYIYRMHIPQGCDLSGIPKRKSYGYDVYPRDDFQVLAWCSGPKWNYFDQFSHKKLEVYGVRVKADTCTVEECFQLLKRIGCSETRFIACSVERPYLFFAKLDKEDADKLLGLDEICYAGQRPDWVFHP